MILSNVAIQDALDRGALVIRPEPSPRQGTDLQRSPFQTTAVDLRLSDEISYFREGLPVNIDLRRGRFETLFSSNSMTEKLTEERPFALNPQKMVLGRTLEWVELPLPMAGNDASESSCLAARVEGRSSYARCGLLVHFTAPTIHAGFKGHITLELINLGRIPVLLFPNIPICQLIVERVEGTPFRNDSQFQGQIRAGGGSQ